MEIEYNHSLYNSDKYKSTVSETEDYFVAVYFSVLGILALVLNITVLVVSGIRRGLLQPPEWFIVILALNDIMWVLTGFYMPVASGFHHRWLFGEVGCTMYAFVSFLVGLFHINVITIMSVVRWLVICVPTSARFVKGRNIILAVFLAFLYSVVWSILPLLGWGEYGFEAFGLACSLNWRARTRSSFTFIITLLVVLYILPVIIITLCYSRIVIYITWRHISSSINRQATYRSRLMIKMTLVMCLSFVFVWTPYAVVSVWSAVTPPEDLPDYFPTISLLPCLFAKSSTIINPCVYFFSIHRFQRHTKETAARLCTLLRHLSKTATNNTRYILTADAKCLSSSEICCSSAV